MTRFGFGRALAAVAILVTVILAGTAWAAERTPDPVALEAPATTTTTTAPVPAPVAAPMAAGGMTVSVDIPCVRPELQHCDPAQPDAP